MLESTKEGATGLPEGSDIGLGARCRVFESPHSDQEKDFILNIENKVFFVLRICYTVSKTVSTMWRVAT